MLSKNSIEEISRSIPPDEQIVLVLQGGGALGAYQYGVYEALTEAKISPDWVIGTSIGAINGGLIAGNPPEKRLSALHTFWDLMANHGKRSNGALKGLFNWITFTEGVKGFFSPNADLWFNPYAPVGIEHASYYSTEPLRETLSQLIDFDYLNSQKTRLTVGAVNANTGQMCYFDTRNEPLTLDHILASGALPPAFPAVRIKGEAYWDGAVSSNSPIEAALEEKIPRNSIVFSVLLWNPEREEPATLQEVLSKRKDIQFASRDHYLDKEKQLHCLRHVIRILSEKLPDTVKQEPATQDLIARGDGATMHVIELTVPHAMDEDQTKDIDFTDKGISDRKAAGYKTTLRALKTHPWSNPVDPVEGVLIHQFK